jgi:putative oxidoreductase
MPYRAEATNVPKGAVLLFGPLLFSLIFIMPGPAHFSKQTIVFAASQGVAVASLAVPLSGLIALAGGLSILLGYR